MVALIYFVILITVFESTHSVPSSSKLKLVIDQDGGADDAMAIFMALLNEKYYKGPKLIALTTTHGNVGEEQVFNNTQRILAVANRRDIPIYRGSNKALIKGSEPDHYFGYDGLGDNNTDTFKSIRAQREPAVVGLIELSKKYSGSLVIVAFGSLTNIALALRSDPMFLSRLSHLYIGAGNIYSENYKEPEFNAYMDVESYHIVANESTPDKVTIIPFSQILTYQKISKEWRVKVLGSIDTKIMQAQNRFEQKSLPVDDYWCLLDPAVMGIVLNEASIVTESRYSNNSIILTGDQRGINTNDFTTKDKANARVIYEVSKEPFKQLLYNLFSAELGSD
ncbi:inosine-uridine preferring nucleoside hydrolase-like [Melitaea cinxia]|uniref:inosine-uridine preferring nucleoside hydrolase-like n=1 Tax=Melitaea cinxia TaxID=113334 RepID=UPI001E26EC2D|nr:inosine-uridine preferring nucleoside hydrolase-like [Melitaea cinxia]